MRRLNYDELRDIRAEHADKRIIFCSGVFDVVHAGHVLFFEDCKKEGDILVVGVGSDAVTKSRKGAGRPIMNEYVRMKMVGACRPVDYYFLDDVAVEEHPLSGVKRAMKLLKPDIYVINDDAFEIEDRKKFVEDLGIELKILPRTCPEEFDNISTTKIIEKIKSL